MSGLARWDPMMVVNVFLAAAAVMGVIISAYSLQVARSTLFLIDRPYLAVEINTIELHDWANPPSDSNGRSVSFDVKNYGKSPALPTRLLVHAVVFKESYLQEQPTPIYRENQADQPGGIIVPDQPMHVEFSGPALELNRTALDEWTARPRKANLFIYGFLDYDDVQRNPHRSCFAFRIVDWEPRPTYWVYVNNKAYWCHT